MNPWSFVVAAYAVALAATAWLMLSSFVSMRRGEAEVDKLRGNDH